MQPLQALGVSAVGEQLYLELIERGQCESAELAAWAELDEGEFAATVSELRAAGLVEQAGERLVPNPPQLVLEALARRHAGVAARARESAVALAQLWAMGAGQRSYLEVLPSYEVAFSVLNRIQVDAQDRVRAMTVGNLASTDQRIPEGQFEALARGVSYQVIYGTQVLRDSAALNKVQRCVDAGEQARVVPEVPMNLAIVDDRWALVASRARVAGKDSVAAFVVHGSPFLTALTGVFETFWRMAVPITTTDVTELDGAPARETKRLLTYLSAGLTDESIAREFGVSERTIARRISRLQEALGAQTRFQLGVQASRQGWL